eukprot:COSAG03_NODE_2544_length_2659_cov_2.055469_1_plen_128_part_00
MFVPRPVAGLGPAYGLRVVAVAAGSYFTLALIANGQVFSWGDNMNGCLGIGMTSKECPSIATPQPIPALATTRVATTRVGGSSDRSLGFRQECIMYLRVTTRGTHILGVTLSAVRLLSGWMYLSNVL